MRQNNAVSSQKQRINPKKELSETVELISTLLKPDLPFGFMFFVPS